MDGAGPGGRVLAIQPGTYVVTVGAAGAGKSTFARQLPPEVVVNPDRIRFEITGDASDQRADDRVWARTRRLVESRLARGCTTLLDSTSWSGEARRGARRTAAKLGAPLLLVVFNTPLDICLARNRNRVDSLRSVPAPDDVVQRQHAGIAQFLASLDRAREDVVVLDPSEAATVRVDLTAGLCRPAQSAADPTASPG